jgi:hypothetical protein
MGEGIIVAPSKGTVHPSGKPYRLVTGGPASIVEIAPEERDDLFALARSLDQRPPAKVRAPRPATTVDGKRPGDVYNRMGPAWEELLLESGWTIANVPTPEGMIYWTRPGKPEGVSASTNYQGSGLLYVFTSSAPPLEAGRSYDKFGAYAALKHDGDWSAAATALAGEGFGKSKRGEGKDKEPNQTDRLLALAHEHYELLRGDVGEGEPFAMEKGGPNVAYVFRGSSSMRARLAALYFETYGKGAGTTAISAAMLTLEGQAMQQDPTPLGFRVAVDGNALIVDIGDVFGKAVIIRPGYWEVVDQSPVIFRRTSVTRALPIPNKAGGDLDKLRDFIHIDDDFWPLLVAWLVAAHLPEFPHTILGLLGGQGSGKSFTSKRLVLLLDPTSALTRRHPDNERDWVVAGNAGWVVCLENVSHIEPWLSDALCRSSTGEGSLERKLYTNLDVSAISFKRVALLNGISFGALRGDLGDRMVIAELGEIADEERKTEEELEAEWRDAYPTILGGLYSTISKVLVKLAKVNVVNPPRMADYAKVLAAVDQVLGTKGLATYMTMREHVNVDVIDNDVVGRELRKFMEGRKEPWEGSVSELTAELEAKQLYPRSAVLPQGWPKFAQGMRTALMRLQPAMPAAGFQAEYLGRVGHEQIRTWRLSRLNQDDDDGRS